VVEGNTTLRRPLNLEGWLGAAWWYRKYSDDQTSAKPEAEARREKRGLWAKKNPTPPWDWRQQQAKGPQPQVEVEIIPNGVEIMALLSNPKGEDGGHEQVVISLWKDELTSLLTLAKMAVAFSFTRPQEKDTC